MTVHLLHLHDFRAFTRAEVAPDPTGITVLTGSNGIGKTSILEAIGYLGLQRSFRGAPREVMIRNGCERAVIRAESQQDGRPVLVEAELSVGGRSRFQVNRQAVRTRQSSASAVPVTVFCPEDLGLVQGGPAGRRDLLDNALELMDPSTAPLVDETERILRQRGALLRQAGGRLTAEVATTLDVWDERLGRSGDALAQAREELAAALGPVVSLSYGALAGAGRTGCRADRPVDLAYRRSWSGNLHDALARARPDDVRRGASTVGPHRDDVELEIGGHSARLQASQGEQRCLALALRLGIHRLVGERSGSQPTLLLDDVFSELDPDRSRALVGELPAGQALLTTAVPLPGGVLVAATIDVRELVGP